MSDKGTHFVLSKKKCKIFLKDPQFPEGGHQAQCFIIIYRRNKFVQGGPLRFWITIDGRKLAKPLEHGDSCVVGVKPGKHIVDVKMPHTGLVNLDKKLETRDLEPGEMQVIEIAICGLTIPYTKVWDLGKSHCPIAVIEKKKKKKETPPPPPQEETTTTTTTTYTAQIMPVMPPQYTSTTTMYALPTTTTTSMYSTQPMYAPQSMYFPSAPMTGQAPLPQGFTPIGGSGMMMGGGSGMSSPMMGGGSGMSSPMMGGAGSGMSSPMMMGGAGSGMMMGGGSGMMMGGTYNPFTNPTSYPSVPQTGGVMAPSSPMMMPMQPQSPYVYKSN